MTKIIVLGHGGYAEGICKSLEMVTGVPENMYFIDLQKEEDLWTFEKKVQQLISEIGQQDILFACDLFGASPFRVAATLTAKNPNHFRVAAGLNAMAFMELAINNRGSLLDISVRAVETTKSSVALFPAVVD